MANLAVMDVSAHTRQTHQLIDIPIDTIGPPGLGVQVLTRNVKPPIKPQPEDEWGIGRSPGQEMTQQEFRIHDNPDWYLGTGAHYDPITSEEFRGRTHVTGQWLNDQLTRSGRIVDRGGAAPIATVQGVVAVPQTQGAVLPGASASAGPGGGRSMGLRGLGGVA
jgi:hypothetical protein